MYRSIVSQNNFSISYITTKSSQEIWKKFRVNYTNLSKDLSNDLPKLWTSIIILMGSIYRSIEPNLYHVFAAHSGAFAIDESHSLVDPFFMSFFVTCCRNIIYHLHMSHTYSIHIYVRGRYSSLVLPNIFSSILHHNNLSQELWKKIEAN